MTLKQPATPQPTIVLDVVVTQTTEGVFNLLITNATGAQVQLGKLPSTTMAAVTTQGAQREATLRLSDFGYEPHGRWKDVEDLDLADNCMDSSYPLWESHRIFKRASS